ncbi:MAG TPA: hypothetical protein ENK18_27560 [Deltaproteobacteria bacterium]|nr:hypothetical protein [Deltaproteobacteria bacterium]
MTAWDTCSLCPRLCRSACPVATGSGREAAVPTWIAWTIRGWGAGQLSQELAAEAASLCTDCGACQEHCHLGRPLPELLRGARTRLLPPPALEPLEPIEGEGSLVVIEADARPLAAWLQRALGRSVRRWSTPDRLGIAAVEHPVFTHRAARLREAVADLEVVVADGGIATVLQRADIAFSWLHEVLPELVADRTIASCRTGGRRLGLACCGAAGPLARHHPEDAERVGALFLERCGGGVLLDARCREHLRRCGASVHDVVDRLGGEES